MLGGTACPAPGPSLFAGMCGLGVAGQDVGDTTEQPPWMWGSDLSRSVAKGVLMFDIRHRRFHRYGLSRCGQVLLQRCADGGTCGSLVEFE